MAAQDDEHRALLDQHNKRKQQHELAVKEVRALWLLEKRVSEGAVAVVSLAEEAVADEPSFRASCWDGWALVSMVNQVAHTQCGNP